jgi:hypothetical protein
LEVLAPDPSQDALNWFRILPRLREPRLIGWAARSTDIRALTDRLQAAGIAHQPLREGSRTQPDGSALRWRTVVLADDYYGLLPFFIEWSVDSVHPATGLPTGCRLERFDMVAPDSEQLKGKFQVFGIDVQITHGPSPRLRAYIACSAGSIELTS